MSMALNLEDREKLKSKIIASLRQQGYAVKDDCIYLPEDISKNELRLLHEHSVASKIKYAEKKLSQYEDKLLENIAYGYEVFPEKISPQLKVVQPKSKDELLFRYATLHWSIPVSSGYGRRLRYLVFDGQNGKLIGLFGLGDPVFSMRARDDWIGWTKEDRKRRLKNVADAFVLGAVPPYNYLLGGKLIAMLAASNEVQSAFFDKYNNRESMISCTRHDGKLALLTTTSALGRSSIYNRLKYKDGLMFHSVGFTAGSGDFHFANGIYEDLVDFARQYCSPTAKNELWGNGFRNRREIIRKVLKELGLSSKYAFHQIQREIYLAPLAENTQAFLQGYDHELNKFNYSASDLFSWFRERWLLPRAERDKRYLFFDPENWRIW